MQDGFIVKYNSIDGTYQTSSLISFGVSTTTVVNGITETSDGGLVITGYTTGAVSLNDSTGGYNNGFLAKFNASTLSKLWLVPTGGYGARNEYPQRVVVAKDQSLFIVG